MKILKKEELQELHAGTSCHISGGLAGAGLVLLAAAVVTGGVGLAVAGGLLWYFSGVSGFHCAVS